MSRGIREPFITNGRSDIENISEKISENIDHLIDLNQTLEGYEARLGSKEDSRSMRKRMKEDISEANELIKDSLDLLRELKDIQPQKPNEREQKSKIQRRVQETFNKQQDRFTRLLKEIKTKEKIYLESKKSMYESRAKGSNASGHSMASSDEDPEMYFNLNKQGFSNNSAAQIQDLDFTEALIKEREKDVQEVRKLAHELNLTAQHQAQRLKEASEDIEVIEGHTDFTVKKTEEANQHLEQAEKYQTRASKKNLILCAVVIVVCIVVVAIVLSNS